MRVVFGSERPLGSKPHMGPDGLVATRRKRRATETKWGCVVLLLLVAACGGSNTNSQNKASPSASEAAVVVGHWVGSCDFSSGSTQNVQLTIDLTQDGTFIATSNGSIVVSSYTLPGPEHMQVTGTRGGKATTTDYTVVSVTGSRMQLAHQDKNQKEDCSFAKSGPPQVPGGPTPSQPASSQPGGESDATQPTPSASESTPESAQSLVGHTWEVKTLSFGMGCEPPWGLSGVEEGMGITRRTFSFQSDGTIMGHDEVSPPDPNSSGDFTLTYDLNGSSLDTRDNSTVESWTIENLTDSSFTLVHNGGAGEGSCVFDRVE